MSRRKALIEAGFILLALLAAVTQPAGVVRDLAGGQAAWAIAAGVSICWAAALLCGLTLRLGRPAQASFAGRDRRLQPHG